ncbi:hypothetical protein SAMN04487820_101371 [Actinopolyspora mzabensis]|uniref:Tetratricopeptide repeat-containing protein n=1 Tax=Actinopolyspora mzabensis TaxID=995066 RepID=A0A1G8VW73_ACTMZ|nr:hypothetical protein [Actinopolyspora mzabensis]SDJ70249.1 hypothetical protein SAMN04487820_101371 [Actinopolyspora mzabensis]
MNATSATTPDPIMAAIGTAVSLGTEGNVETARRDLLAIWRRIGAVGDPLHRCTLAHHLADLYEEPAESLVWDVRALDAAEALTDQRAREYHASLHVAGFYPSLHLNLADDFRRLGLFQAATEHINEAENHTSELPEGAYGDTIRTAVHEVVEAIAERDTTPRASAPHAVQ